MFNNPESMSFHGFGQPPCSGKDSTVEDQLLLVCSLVRGGELGLWHLFLCIFFQDF